MRGRPRGSQGKPKRTDIVGRDGLSRLRLGQAVYGEIEKGYRDPDEIAANVAELYCPRWLERELGRPFSRSRYIGQMALRIEALLNPEQMAA